MGEYAAIHGLIRNITVNEVRNYFSKRYGSPAEAKYFGEDFGTIISMMPEFYMTQVFESGNNVILNGCEKYGTFKSGLERTMSFYVIADICRRLGDSEVRSSGIDDISDEEDLEDCRLEARYDRRDRPDLRMTGNPSSLITGPLCRYYMDNVTKGNKSKTIKTDSWETHYSSEKVPEIVYRQAGIFFRSWKLEDIKAFYNTCHIAYWCWCTDRDGWKDLKNVTAEDFAAFIPEFAEYLRADLSAEDMRGFLKVFEHVKNKAVSEYCRQKL